MPEPRSTMISRVRFSADLELPGVFEDEAAPDSLVHALPLDFQRFDAVRYFVVPPAWCTGFTVRCWRYSSALDAWFEDPDAGGSFAANAIVTQQVLGDRVAMTITDITGTVPAAPEGGVAYDAEDLIQRCARAYLVGA